MNIDIDPPRLLKVTEVCALLGVGKHTLLNYREAGEGPPYVRFASSTIRYPSDELEAWIEASREVAS